jgi:hypothetical protein
MERALGKQPELLTFPVEMLLQYTRRFHISK